MTDVTLAQVCDAIKTTLLPVVSVAQTYNELSEGIHDENLIQIYPESSPDISTNSGTDRRTFGSATQKPKRQDVTIYHVDYYATQRSNIGDDMAKLLPGITAITNKLNSQDGKPYFGLAGIKSFHWRWERVTFDYGGVAFVGARFIIEITIF